MNVPFPLFPSRFSLPSFPTRSSQWRLWLTRVPSSPSLCIPFPPPPFPLFPALFPYWRLCPRPLSLLTIMFPPSFPIFDYAPSPFPYFWLCPDTPCPWCPYVTFTRLLKVQFYVLSIWVSRPDNYYLCTELCSIFSHYFQCRRALFKNGCSSPLK
jgi:hypothetical protein